MWYSYGKINLYNAFPRWYFCVDKRNGLCFPELWLDRISPREQSSRMYISWKLRGATRFFRITVDVKSARNKCKWNRCWRSYYLFKGSYIAYGPEGQFYGNSKVCTFWHRKLALPCFVRLCRSFVAQMRVQRAKRRTPFREPGLARTSSRTRNVPQLNCAESLTDAHLRRCKETNFANESHACRSVLNPFLVSIPNSERVSRL